MVIFFKKILCNGYSSQSNPIVIEYFRKRKMNQTVISVTRDPLF